MNKEQISTERRKPGFTIRIKMEMQTKNQTGAVNPNTPKIKPQGR